MEKINLFHYKIVWNFVEKNKLLLLEKNGIGYSHRSWFTMIYFKKMRKYDRVTWTWKFDSFSGIFSFLLHHFVLAELPTSSIRVKVFKFKYIFFHRQIIFCGEVVTSGLLNRCIKAFPHIQFLNLYSVSECHDVSYADLSKFHAEIEVCAFQTLKDHYYTMNKTYAQTVS